MLVGSKGPTKGQTMSVIELSWTAKKVGQSTRVDHIAWIEYVGHVDHIDNLGHVNYHKRC